MDRTYKNNQRQLLKKIQRFNYYVGKNGKNGYKNCSILFPVYTENMVKDQVPVTVVNAGVNDIIKILFFVY